MIKLLNLYQSFSIYYTDNNMSTVNRFEDLVCWQKARLLVKQIYILTSKAVFRDFSLKDQIQRAAVSIMVNIAEGFERGTKDEFLYFLYIAKGSSGEVRSHLYVALDQGFISQEEFDKTVNMTREASGILYKFIESLKVSKYQGLRRKVGAVESPGDKFMEEIKERYLKGKNF